MTSIEEFSANAPAGQGNGSRYGSDSGFCSDCGDGAGSGYGYIDCTGDER